MPLLYPPDMDVPGVRARFAGANREITDVLASMGRIRAHHALGNLSGWSPPITRPW